MIIWLKLKILIFSFVGLNFSNYFVTKFLTNSNGSLIFMNVEENQKKLLLEP